MPAVHHPTFDNVEVDVPADKVDEWRESGWKAPGVPSQKPQSDTKD